MDPYKYIDKFEKFGAKGGYKPGLKRIEALLEVFGHPENKIRVIHVAGSNGKGSTITFLKSIYIEAGYRTGVYTSPHLLEFNERIEINGRKISTEELSELVCKIKPVVDKIRDSELGEPSFFELVTALAFMYFEQQKVDLVLLETGLGGRLDATNIVKKPEISVITGISLEHTSILGDTIEEIAAEKAGIIKEGVPVLTGARDRRALKVIEDIADKRGSKLTKIIDKYDYLIKESSLEGQEFSLMYRGVQPEGRVDEGTSYKIALRGEYQVRNAILALEVVNELQSRFPVREEEIRKGLLKAYIPGRMEILLKKPLVLLDGAHNSEGIAEAVNCLLKFRDLKEKKGKILLVLAVLADKDIDKMLREIIRLQDLEIIISENNNSRALSAEIIKEKLDVYNANNRIILPMAQALISAEKQAGADDIIFITGSLYNTAEVKKHYCFIDSQEV